MRKIAAVLLMLVAPGVWADFYISADFVVASNRTSDDDRIDGDDTSGYAAAIGHAWPSGWYMEIGASSLSNNHSQTEQVSADSRSTVTVDYDAARYQLVVGRLFTIANNVGFYVEAGPASHSVRTTTTTTLTTAIPDQDPATLDSVLVDSSRYRDDDSGVSYVAGVGVSIGDKNTRLKITARQYGEPEEATVSIGGQFMF